MWIRQTIIGGVLASLLGAYFWETLGMEAIIIISSIYALFFAFDFAYTRGFISRIKNKRFYGLWVGKYAYTGSNEGKDKYKKQSLSFYVFIKPKEKNKIEILQSHFGLPFDWDGEHRIEHESYGEGIIKKDKIQWEYKKPNNKNIIIAQMVGEQIQGTFESIWHDGGTKYWGDLTLNKMQQ